MLERIEELFYSKPRVILAVFLLLVALLILTFSVIQIKALLFPPCSELIEKYENSKKSGGIPVPEFIAIPERCRAK